MATLRDLLAAGFDLDTPIVCKQNDDPDDDNVFGVALGYELTVTIDVDHREEGRFQAILLTPDGDTLYGAIIHD